MSEPKITREDVDQLDVLLGIAHGVEDEGPHGDGWQSGELRKALKCCTDLEKKLRALLPPE